MPFKSLADKKMQKKPFFKDSLLKNGKNSKKSFKFPINNSGFWKILSKIITQVPVGFSEKSICFHISPAATRRAAEPLC